MIYPLLFHAALAGLCAWYAGYFLKQPGQLLYPLKQIEYRWLEGKYGNVEEHTPFWWKPIWGCSTCMAAWWGMSAVAYHLHENGLPFYWWLFPYAAAVAMTTALLTHKVFGHGS